MYDWLVKLFLLALFFGTMVVILVLSASMSTLFSLVLASSSTLTLDFLADTVKRTWAKRERSAPYGY